MSEFKLTLEAMWANDSTFEEFVPLVKNYSTEEEVLSNVIKTNKKKNKKNKVKSNEINDDCSDQTMSEDEEIDS